MMDKNKFNNIIEDLEYKSYSICKALMSKDIVVLPAGRFCHLTIKELARWDIRVKYLADKTPELSKGRTGWNCCGNDYIAQKTEEIIREYGNSVNYVISSRPFRIEIEQELLCNGIKKENIFYVPARIGELVPQSVFGRRMEVSRSFEEILKATELLEDDESREQLWELLAIFCANAPVWKEKTASEEYFNTPYIRFKEKEIFVDAGMYDGNTTRRFAELCPEYECIYGIEANPYNIDRIKDNLVGVRDISICNNALCNSEKILKFGGEEEGARITKNGNISVKGIKGDAMNIAPTYIKFDIEGAEYDALLGFENTICKYKPKMAVSAYHNLQDHWRLIPLIKSMSQEYKLYLKHHYGYEDLYGTILYATIE